MNEDRMSASDVQPQEKNVKLGYKAPVLTVHGNIEAITQSNGKSRNSDAAGYTCQETGANCGS
jgi:hypothetical protein